MSKNTFVQSIKTIAESLIQKAGFDKTRSGKIVGVNTLTNTYSVRIDGYTYNNVRVVDDATYNVGDTVKVNIPCNQPSQMYIASSSFSDSSIGKKIGHAESTIGLINNQIGSIVDIDGDIYQLTFESSYTSTNSTHTGIVRKNGENVTSSTYWDKFKWYLLKSTGKQQITSGISDNVLTMPIADYKYGMALILEWVDANNNVLARYSITIVDNSQIDTVAQQAGDAITIANDTQQYFWHTETGTDTGAHITQVPKDTFLQNPSGSNLLARSDGIAFRQGLNELGVLTSGGAYYNALVNNQYRVIAQYTPTSIQLGLSDAGYDNLYINPSGSDAGMYFRNGSINIAKYTTSGMYLYNSSGYPTMSATSGAFVIYDGTNYQRNLLNVGTSGMTLRNSSGYTTFTVGANSMIMYTGTSSNVALATFGTSGMTLKNSSGYTLCTVSDSGMTVYNSSGTQLANFGSTATIGQTSSYNMYFTSGTLNFRYGGTTAGYINANTSGTYMTIKSNGKAVYSSTGDMQINSQSTTDATSSGDGSLVIWAGGGLGLLSSAAGLVFRNTTSSDGYGIIRPMGDQSDVFGTTTNRWWKIYTYGVDTGSDRKLKDITGDISFAKDLIMSLNPVEFMWKNGDHRRTRMGFIAQEVAEWAKSHNLNLSVYSASFKDDDDMTAYYGEDIDDEQLIWSMEYEQLIAPVVKVIQEQQHTIDNLTQRIEALES